MTRKFSPLVAFSVLTAALLLAGCGAQKGKTVFTAGPDSGTNIGKAPASGRYALYTSTSPNPVVTVELKEGDPIGFKKADDGRIEAVWQDKKYDLNKLTFQVYWKQLD